MQQTKRKCNLCPKSKRIKAYGFCESCYKKLKRQTDPLYFLKHLHVKLKQRCTNPMERFATIYYGKNFCTQKEFLDKFSKDSVYLEVFYKWVASGCARNMAPSVDRINNAGDYQIHNLQMLALTVNCIKDKPNVQVKAFNKESGSFVNTFNSIADAARALNINQTGISRCVKGLQAFAGGYTFERIENE